MADERYQWLDQEAAERLLRGEPVDPVDDASRTQAELLARALDTARTPAVGLVAGPDGELPGEAAALAAFRKAVAERAAGAAAPGHAGQTATDLGRVRISPLLSGRRWGRSLRYGLAAAVAAVTVGGVAVAAGTGMLPLTTDPEPGTSVVSVGTPPTGESGSPGTAGSPSGGAGTEVPGVPTGRDGKTATPGATDGPGTATAGTGGPDGGTATPDATADGRSPIGDERSKVIQACRDYRSGRLADGGRDRLARALRSGETVKRYCDRILSGAPTTATPTPQHTAGRTSSGSSGSGGSGDAGSGGSGGSDGDDKNDRGDRNHGKNRGEDGGKNAGAGGGPGGGTPGGTHGRDRSRS
ncbi:hypothetical protein [Streptomyces roseicoloratus]|uniref:Extensin n=1 Tax=Streptomyces roseicoloratus TaxID=2508722 RepID=A0ABY9RV88_9ACTN|nr:hypothetical protein [Streptomyces roseicoloratus]WMX45406.1 hypothetical protein RGF97_11835 [Streptomyces roseicoloratus]